MNTKIIKQTDFEFPIVTTKDLLKKEYKDVLLSTKDMYILDLGINIEIFEYFTPSHYLQEESVKSTTEYLLLQVANAYKWIDDEVLYVLLEDYADKIRKKSLGGIISIEMYKNYIQLAMANKDTIEVAPNKTLRFLTNPYYNFKEGEYSRRGQLRIELINKALSIEKKDINYKRIYNYISDYDLVLSTITKKQIAKETELSYATVKNYFKDNIDLQIIFEEVRKASGTLKQKDDRKYYKNRICKKAN
jgi:hypothetical protein